MVAVPMEVVVEVLEEVVVVVVLEVGWRCCWRWGEGADGGVVNLKDSTGRCWFNHKSMKFSFARR